MPYDHQLARQAAALVRRLPVLDTPQFHEDYLTVHFALQGRGIGCGTSRHAGGGLQAKVIILLRRSTTTQC